MKNQIPSTNLQKKIWKRKGELDQIRSLKLRLKIDHRSQQCSCSMTMFKCEEKAVKL